MKRLLTNPFACVCVILGIALLVGGVLLWVTAGPSAGHGQIDTLQILEKAQALMPQAADRVPEERGNNTMAAMQIDGVNVVGVLEFPQYGRTLPVASQWDTALVSSMPCRFTGSIYDRTIILGAVDGSMQLPFAAQMEVGDRVLLTDMEGGRYTYRVAAIHHAKHATLEKLQSGDYPMTIFVRVSKTSEYLLIRCQIGE